MPYSPSLVANAFLYKAQQSAVPLTHMKLQKLVFFMHAWSLAMYRQSVVGEKPEAWQYGPVFDTLYHELKGNRSAAISEFIPLMNPATGVRQGMIPVLSDTHFWGLVDQVWARYGGFSAMQLSALTHEAGGPWEAARRTNAGWLTDEQIMEYYGRQLQYGN